MTWSDSGITSVDDSATTETSRSDTSSWFLSNSTTDTSDSTDKTVTSTMKETAVSLSTLESRCRELLPYVNVHKYSLPTHASQIFHGIVSLGAKVSGTEQYDDFHMITNKVFSGYTSTIRGTVAEQFTGCKGGKDGCHEECAGNFPSKHYTASSFCRTHVGVYQGGEINIHYSPMKACKVLLVHSPTQTIDMHPALWSSLSTKGISIVNVSTRNASGGKDVKTYTNGSAKPSAALSQSKPSAALSHKKNISKKHDDDSDWSVLILIIIIIIIVVVVVILACTRVYSNDDTVYRDHNVHRIRA